MTITLPENRRAAALLRLAIDRGHDVEESEHTPDCWTVRAPGRMWGEPSITIYAEPRHSASVMYDPGYGSAWRVITQSMARTILTGHLLGPQSAWDTQSEDLT